MANEQNLKDGTTEIELATILSNRTKEGMVEFVIKQDGKEIKTQWDIAKAKVIRARNRRHERREGIDGSIRFQRASSGNEGNSQSQLGGNMPDETYDDPNVPSGYYGEKMLAAQTAGMSLGSLRNPPVRKVVEQQIVELKAQLKEREEFLKELDANPGVEKVLDRMRKLHI
jgi:hypothetical protein